ncbi:MAG: hypothetical protein B0A82_17445 [Alkalinema sp. CACIAM 70d]|nr:MAG: hypothetical protein B0A82_17445 [Alkalinema sp. CACIAM 70d]
MSQCRGAVVGVDGCRSGWLAVAIEASGRRHFQVLNSITDVEIMAPAIVAIDMPIGLPETGVRTCDLAARQFLGPSRNRVFTGARRPLLMHVESYDLANAWGKSDRRGISKQLFCILPKIAEVDNYLRSRTTQFPIRETHPELVFQRLNDGKHLAGKKSPTGLRHRRDLVYARGFDQIDEWLGALRGTGAKPDDLLDACACAFAAKSGQRLQCDEESDACGLPMEMWY